MRRFNKRNILVFSLVMVLCFISYLNFAINKYSLLETSTDFEKYEENKLAEVYLEDEAQINDPLEDIVMNEENGQQDLDAVRVVDSTENEISNLVRETSSNIVGSISNSTVRRSNYFIEARLNTSIEREKMVVLLNEIINNDRTDDGNRKAANDAKMKLVDSMSKEKIIENLIKAKGFEEALVLITDNSVNVIVEAEKLADSDVAKILDIIMRETKVDVKNIKIQNKF